MSEPSPKTIKRVVEYLESIGLSVYGPMTTLATGAQYCGCRDFSPDAVLVYRKLYQEDKLFPADQSE